jgi:hypothetical protein
LTVNDFGGDVFIENEEDGGRIFSFTDLQTNEVITIQNDYQIISSSTGLKRLGNFNKHWLRFLPGKNTLHITGSVASISNTYSLIVKKVGG